MNEDEKKIEEKRMVILESKLDPEEELPGKLERERSVLARRKKAFDKIADYQKDNGGMPSDEEADNHFMTNNLLNFNDQVSYDDLNKDHGE